MTKGQAIKLSIKHWHDNLCCVEEGYYRAIGYSGDSCPLCQKYYDCEAVDDPCSNCPLKMIGDCCLNIGSSWYVVSNLLLTTVHNEYNPEKDVIRKAVVELIDSLESLED